MPQAKGKHSTILAALIRADRQAAGARANCRVHTCAVSTVRKHFVGTGNLKRDEAKRAVMDRCRLLGWPIANGEGRDDDNRADANAVWAYSMALTFPTWAPNGTPLFKSTPNLSFEQGSA